MESNLSNQHAPLGADAPFMKLPTHVDGFIDMQTLIDIHKYLSESEKSDDVTLAAWVKEKYLYEPILEEGRQIRNTEGFVKLDAAYRRVRLLTGKAQDKWPFFDKNWKKMSSTVVKSVVLGDATMGNNRPVTNGGARGSPVSNGFDGQHDPALHEPKLQVPFDTKNPTRHQVQSQKSSQPAAPVLASQSRPEQQAQRQAPEPLPASSPSSTSGSPTHKKSTNMSTLDSTANVAAAPTNSLRDARAGKVRGSHGRFMNNNNNKVPSASRKGPNIKYVKKPRSKATLDTESEETYLSNEGVKTPQVLYAVGSGPSSDNDDETTQSSSPNSTKDRQTTNSSINDSPASSILAAEAEAVPSNLDRLPPGSTGKKRKSESTIQRGGNKRGRGSRGGMLGRPRKSQLAAMDSPPNANEVENVETVQSKAGDTAKMATRRSTRKSAVSALEPPASIEPPGENDLWEVPQQKSDGISTHLVTNNIGVALGSGGLAQKKLNGIISPDVNGIDKPVQDVFLEAPSGDFPVAQSTMPASQAPDTRKGPMSSKQKKRVSFSPEIAAVDLAFFARITTSGVTEEIRLSEEDLVSGGDIVKRYAAWQKSGEASVTFETFKNIMKFAK